MWAEKSAVAGSDLLADLAWGTHLCLFYRTKQDLAPLLVPYFQAGLENNELCVWVTSEPRDAEIALRQAVEDLADRVQNGQMEISHHTSWYAGSATFQPDKVLRHWLKRERRAAKRGFEGLRIAGDTSWIRKADWKAFVEYEAEANRWIGTHRAIAVCAYPLEGRTAAEIVDIVAQHQASMVQRDGDWEIVEWACRKWVGEALDSSRREWDATFDAMSDGVFLLDLDGRVLRCNRAAEEWAGMPLDRIAGDAGERCCKLLHGLRTPLPDCPLQKMLHTHRRETAEFQAPNGDRWVQITVDPVHDRQGQLAAAVHVVRDVTDRKRAEAAASLTSQKLRTVFDAIQGCITVIDLEFNITGVNSAMLDAFGLQQEEHVIGRKCFDVFMGRSEFCPSCAVAEAYRTKASVCRMSTDSDLERTRGRTFEIFAYPILDEEGNLSGAVEFSRDVTEQKEAEEKLRQTKTQLAHVGRLSALGEMVAGIAHEVNQPLYSILNFAKASRNVLAAGDPPNLDDLCQWNEEIAGAAARAGAILHRLRDFARGADPLHRHASISEVVAETVKLVAFETQQRRITVQLDLAEELAAVQTDPVQIQQVLVNLLRNACEAIDRAGADARRVAIRAMPAGQFVEVAVEDSGPGLPTLEQLNIFDPFVTTKPDGLGMGLAISKTIVEAHGGTLWASAAAQGGAAFHFTLPVCSGRSNR